MLSGLTFGVSVADVFGFGSAFVSVLFSGLGAGLGSCLGSCLGSGFFSSFFGVSATGFVLVGFCSSFGFSFWGAGSLGSSGTFIDCSRVKGSDLSRTLNVTVYVPPLSLLPLLSLKSHIWLNDFDLSGAKVRVEEPALE